MYELMESAIHSVLVYRTLFFSLPHVNMNTKEGKGDIIKLLHLFKGTNFVLYEAKGKDEETECERRVLSCQLFFSLQQTGEGWEKLLFASSCWWLGIKVNERGAMDE